MEHKMSIANRIILFMAVSTFDDYLFADEAC